MDKYTNGSIHGRGEHTCGKTYIQKNIYMEKYTYRGMRMDMGKKEKKQPLS